MNTLNSLKIDRTVRPTTIINTDVVCGETATADGRDQFRNQGFHRAIGIGISFMLLTTNSTFMTTKKYLMHRIPEFRSLD